MSDQYSLEDQILNDYQFALKKGDRIRINCLRLLRSEIKNREIDKKEKLESNEIIQIIRSFLKKERESLEYFMQASRNELIDQTKEEIRIIEKYLPAQLIPEEIEKIAFFVVNENNFKGMKDFGSAMKIILKQVKGRADGGLVSQILKKLLENE